jgi:hypothetical protein
MAMTTASGRTWTIAMIFNFSSPVSVLYMFIRSSCRLQPQDKDGKRRHCEVGKEGVGLGVLGWCTHRKSMDASTPVMSGMFLKAART